MQSENQPYHQRVINGLRGKFPQPYSILLFLLVSGLTLIFWEIYQVKRHQKQEKEQVVLHHIGWIGEDRSCTPEHWHRSYQLEFVTFVQMVPVPVALIQHTATTRYHMLVRAEWGDAMGLQCPTQEVYRIKVGDCYEPFVFLGTTDPNGYVTCEQAREAIKALKVMSPTLTNQHIFLSSPGNYLESE